MSSLDLFLTRDNFPLIKSKIIAKLQGKVEEAYLFGSSATEKFHSGSDIDLIIVKDTNLPFALRAREFLDLHKIFPEIDILVYSKKELDLKINLNSEFGFWSSVKETMKKII